MVADVLSVVEAAYRVEEPEEQWVAGIVRAAKSLIDVGLGVFACLYDASGPTGIDLRTFSHEGLKNGVTAEGMLTALAQTPKKYVDHRWRVRPCGYSSELPGFDELSTLESYWHPHGIADIFAVVGADPTGHGCYLGAARPKRSKLDGQGRAIWSRVAAHLAAGFRLRRALGSSVLDGAEAVLTPSGKIEHAEGEASEASARDSLRAAVLRVERARGKMRRTDPAEAVEEWRGLVAARWSLVEHFESDGRRYMVARRNDPDAAGFDALTRRERQVLGYAALGHSNKLIAYELGVSASTVGVLFLRAARKLRGRNRAEVVAAWRAVTKDLPRVDADRDLPEGPPSRSTCR
jgi:DNA-binding CsgD family transcriptional regulator